ncbi:hypothetical protein BAC3_00649 [uncultured bacterium]|nr:hypothetical protein BAC3_00649 [uncultured bacterium]
MFVFCALAVFVSGCSVYKTKESFQVYAPQNDCVSCAEQEKWGFEKKTIFRNGKIVYFASFTPKTSVTEFQLERISLCYGMALDTIKSGATHFRILDREKWGDWYVTSTPAEINVDPLGTARVYRGGVSRKNRDQSGMWWTNNYYEVGSPDCNNSQEQCSTKHKFDVNECKHEGDSLRKETELKKGSLSCVMKRNPRLLLHKVYSLEAGCGLAKEEKAPANIDPLLNEQIDQMLEAGYWVPANDIVKKFEMLFKSDDL